MATDMKYEVFTYLLHDCSCAGGSIKVRICVKTVIRCRSVSGRPDTGHHSQLIQLKSPIWEGMRLKHLSNGAEWKEIPYTLCLYLGVTQKNYSKNVKSETIRFCYIRTNYCLKNNLSCGSPAKVLYNVEGWSDLNWCGMIVTNCNNNKHNY